MQPQAPMLNRNHSMLVQVTEAFQEVQQMQLHHHKASMRVLDILLSVVSGHILEEEVVIPTKEATILSKDIILITVKYLSSFYEIIIIWQRL